MPAKAEYQSITMLTETPPSRASLAHRGGVYMMCFSGSGMWLAPNMAEAVILDYQHCLLMTRRRWALAALLVSIVETRVSIFLKNSQGLVNR